MPCCAYAHCTSPEQSKPFAAVPPHTYGVPSASSALRTTSAALPVMVAGGTGAGRAVLRPTPPLAVPPPPPPPPLPLPLPLPRQACLPMPSENVRAASTPSREFEEARQNPRGPTSCRR